jgi:NAD-specific glutamate dehydrogenase
MARRSATSVSSRAGADHRLELRAGEAHLGVALGQHHRDRHVGLRRQGLLGVDALLAQLGQPGGRARVDVVECVGAEGQGVEDVPEHRVVEVDAAEALDAVGPPDDLEPLRPRPHERGVERAAAQVVDGHHRARRQLPLGGVAAATGSGTRWSAGTPAWRSAWRSRSSLNSPQLAGWVTARDAGGLPSVAATWSTTQCTTRAISSSAATGDPPSSSGVGSPTRRLNSRATRWGSVTARRAAGSPTRNCSPARYTTVGTDTLRVPSPTASARACRPTAAAV